VAFLGAADRLKKVLVGLNVGGIFVFGEHHEGGGIAEFDGAFDDEFAEAGGGSEGTDGEAEVGVPAKFFDVEGPR